MGEDHHCIGSVIGSYRYIMSFPTAFHDGFVKLMLLQPTTDRFIKRMPNSGICHPWTIGVSVSS